jgi:hypothetical protein
MQNSMGLGLLIIVGSIVAYGWSLCFKEYKPLAYPENPLMSSVQARRYDGCCHKLRRQLGAEHIGWIVGATLFAMRPNIEVQKWRSGGSVISVFFLCCYTDSQLLLILNIASSNECWRPCWVYVCLVSSSRRKN